MFLKGLKAAGCFLLILSLLAGQTIFVAGYEAHVINVTARICQPPPELQPGKIVGWGIIPQNSPALLVKIFAYWKFLPDGVVEVEDEKNGLTIKSTKLNSVMTETATVPMTGEIIGYATVNGEGPYEFTVRITDNGNPPDDGEDTFTITIPAIGYSSGGKLSSGNLKVIIFDSGPNQTQTLDSTADSLESSPIQNSDDALANDQAALEDGEDTEVLNTDEEIKIQKLEVIPSDDLVLPPSDVAAENTANFPDSASIPALADSAPETASNNSGQSIDSPPQTAIPATGETLSLDAAGLPIGEAPSAVLEQIPIGDEAAAAPSAAENSESQIILEGKNLSSPETPAEIPASAETAENTDENKTINNSVSAAPIPATEEAISSL